MEAPNGTVRTWSRLRTAVSCALCRGDAGQGYVEYALILILMAMLVLVLLSVVGHETRNVFSNVSIGIAR